MRFKVFDRDDRVWFGGAATGAEDVRARAFFREALDGVDAPDDLSERVMEMARTTGSKTRESLSRRMPVRVAVACAALGVAVVGTAAYAAVSNADFFQSAFGGKGQEDVAAHDVPVEGKDSTVRLPEMTWVETDPADAERIVGDYVGTAGQSVEAQGYTLTVDQVVVDENGLGVATYTLSNPDGVGEVDDLYGQFGFVDAPIQGVAVEGATQRELYDGITVPTFYDYRSVKDENLSTDTELHAVVYFCSPYGTLDENGLAWRLSVPDGSGTPSGSTVVYAPESVLPATTLTAESGETVSLSPLGLVAPASVSESYRCCTVEFSDGTEYVIQDERYYEDSSTELVNNTIFGLYLSEEGEPGSESGLISFLFNRLVDVDAVTAVVFENAAGEQIVFER